MELYSTSLPTYSVETWDNYATVFASITNSLQVGVYKEACLYLKGTVVDCGCGSAKIAPFLANQANIASYTGIDYSKEMVDIANKVLQILNKPNFQIVHSKIEELAVTRLFDSAVSIQSYYSWSQPEKVLKCIWDLLKPDGYFVLASVNDHLPIDLLTQDIQQELIAHPNFESYQAYNLKLAKNRQANFISLDKLITQVQQVGFEIEECHQRHFRSGLNFLVLKKGS